MNIETEATANTVALSKNPYPGRGFVIGKTNDGAHIVQVYWLMGRSEQSRNRRLVHDGSTVRTEAIDSTKVTDSSLIIYNAMREESIWHVVSNGDQTDTVFQMEKHKGGDFREAMREREFEPDAPNYTPRIAGIYERLAPGVHPIVTIAILSRSEDGNCVRTFYEYDDVPPGFGYCVHTYAGDGVVLPSFQGQPLLMPLNGTFPMEVSDFYWSLLNEKNRVALVTKFIGIKSGNTTTHILNRF